MKFFIKRKIGMIILSELSCTCRYRVQVLFIKSRISSKNLTYRLVFYLKKKKNIYVISLFFPRVFMCYSLLCILCYWPYKIMCIHTTIMKKYDCKIKSPSNHPYPPLDRKRIALLWYWLLTFSSKRIKFKYYFSLSSTMYNIYIHL